MDPLTRWLDRRAMRRRIATNDETVRHGFRAGDRVWVDGYGLGKVWMADPLSSWLVQVDLDEPVMGHWLLDFSPHQLERV